VNEKGGNGVVMLEVMGVLMEFIEGRLAYFGHM